MDESLQILRGLGEGAPVTFDGEFFAPRGAHPPRALAAGTSDRRRTLGRGGRRAAKFGDGWLGIWVSPRRFSGM